MRSIFILISAVILSISISAQTPTVDLNPGFEKVKTGEKIPEMWSTAGAGYTIRIDDTVKKAGNNSLLIEAPADRKEGTAGIASISFPAGYEGKEIELSGYIKLENVADGFAGLWLRIDGENGVLQFDNMMSRNIKGTADWTKYTIKLPLPADGERILMGALLTGKGKIWVDDLEVKIDGLELAWANKRPINESKAKKDKEFDAGSKIDALKLDKGKIEDLAVLGKVWGYLKYYHPAVAAGDHNWDYELFRVMPKVLAAKNRQDRNAVLSAWFASLGIYETALPPKTDAEKIKLTPDLKWIDEKTLGQQLAGRLTALKDAKRLTKSYYIGMQPGVGNPQFKNENSYETMKYPDAGFRMLALFRFWNIIQYYFPNRHLIEEDWNKILPEFIPQFASAANELEYKLAALKLIGRIHDTHANLFSREDTMPKYWGLNRPAVKVSFIEDKAVVVAYHDKAEGERTGLKVGDVIEEINGRKVADIVKERLDLYPASNYPTKLRDIAGYLLRTNENSMKLKYRRDKTVSEVTVDCLPKSKYAVNPDAFFDRSLPSFKMIGEDVAYLYPGTLKRGEMQTLLPKIEKTKGLIVDMRTYPSDFIVFSLGQFLLSKPTDFVKFSQGSITTPGLFTMPVELKVGIENPNPYKGKVVILINEITQSQAEYTTMALRTAPRATVVGSTTAGADGNVSEFYLPGGIGTMISGIGVLYPDGRETQRVGIVPDVVVKPTIKGIAEGRDELVQKALEIITADK